MNVVTLVGNLCFNNNLKYTSGDNATAILHNTVAVQRKFKNKNTGEYESDFISIQAFGSNAEFINKYFNKGSKIGIAGEIRTGSYTNKDGQKVYTTYVLVNNAEFVSKREEGTEGGTTSSAKNDGFIDVPDDLCDSLPFK